jgi:hypothetical protein
LGRKISRAAAAVTRTWTMYDDDCREEARAVLLGATNSWFPIALSAPAIPLARDPISQLVQDGWEYFADLDSEAEVGITLKQTGALPGVD